VSGINATLPVPVFLAEVVPVPRLNRALFGVANAAVAEAETVVPDGVVAKEFVAEVAAGCGVPVPTVVTVGDWKFDTGILSSTAIVPVLVLVPVPVLTGVPVSVVITALSLIPLSLPLPLPLPGVGLVFLRFLALLKMLPSMRLMYPPLLDGDCKSVLSSLSTSTSRSFSARRLFDGVAMVLMMI